jgi:hypothetical protein
VLKNIQILKMQNEIDKQDKIKRKENQEKRENL